MEDSNQPSSEQIDLPTHTNINVDINTMEDFNEPSSEQIDLPTHTNINVDTNTMKDSNQPSPEQIDLPTHTNINVDINTMEDFNEPSPERIDLLKRLEARIGGNVTPHFWAACQICDPDKLAGFLDGPPLYVKNLSNLLYSEMVRFWGSSFRGVRSQSSTPKISTPQISTASNLGSPQISTASNLGSPSTVSYLSKRQRTSDSPLSLPRDSKRQKTLDSPSSLPRGTNAKNQAAERDHFCCVLTGIEWIEVAHIYPHHGLKAKEDDINGPRHLFWESLEMFWPTEKVATWKARLFPNDISNKGQEEVYNLISLAPQAHGMWGQGLFALKPISESDDKKKLTVQFFWQTKQMDSFPTISLTVQPHSTKGLKQITGAHGGGIWLTNKNLNPIQSGDLFELNTDDPITKPLPSFELLELQWFLQRVQGMAGAAEIDWMKCWPEIDSDDSDYGVEETPSLISTDEIDRPNRPQSTYAEHQPAPAPISFISRNIMSKRTLGPQPGAGRPAAGGAAPAPAGRDRGI